MLHRSYISNKYKASVSEYKSEYKGMLDFEGYDFEANLEDAMDTPLENQFFSGRMTILQT